MFFHFFPPESSAKATVLQDFPNFVGRMVHGAMLRDYSEEQLWQVCGGVARNLPHISKHAVVFYDG